MRLVVVESPYAGDVETHMKYLRDAMADCFSRGEAPFASHGLYPGTLDDSVKDQRALGMAAGFAWAEHADARVFYLDFGWSPGMWDAFREAERLGQQVVYRTLPGWRKEAAL